ncbi:MAG: Ig-like domain-containing protein [Gallionella sp.]|nr:Ig-like domain-containing protein [Gallionella sp.]
MFTAPGNSGSVTVQVDALDVDGKTLATLTRTFLISAPASAAAKLFLSPAVSTVVPSSGSYTSTTTLEVTVRDASNNAVGGAAVMFGLLATTGSGEFVSPAVTYTDSYGKASTTFTAGTAPTLAKIYAQARVVGQVCTFAPDPLVAEINSMCDAAPMIVSSSAVSVTVTFGTKIEDTANFTQYRLPGSVMVVNSNGSGVAGVPVTLTAFPVEYRNGKIMSGKTWNGTSYIWECIGPFNTTIAPTWDPVNLMWWYTTPTYFTAAEDVNRNGILDANEDTPLAQTASQIAAQAISNSGYLSPEQAAGGTVPLTVTTDSTGAATFFLQYPKASARFIKDEITARVIVMGTESSSRMTLELPMSMSDNLLPTCPLGREASY